MAELFAESGASADLALSPPNLQGIFIPGIDNPYMSDGLGLVIPWGSGGTARKYQDYGPSSTGSSNDTQLRDMTSYFLPGGGGGISYNFEGLVGPTGPVGPAGPQGLPGASFGLYSPSGLFALSNSLQQIDALGTKINQMIYTSAITYYYTWTLKGTPSSSGTAHFTWVDTNTDGSIIYSAENSWQFRKSTDYGDNWTIITPPGMAGKLYTSVSTSNDGQTVVLTIQNNEHVWVSTDGGSNWTERYPVAPGPSTNYFCSAISHDGSVIYVGDSTKRLWKSTDLGANWTEIRPAGDFNKGWAGIACSSDGTNVVTVNTTDTTKIYYSNNGGTDWSSKTTANTPGWKEVTCSSSGAIMIAVGGVDIVYISENSGSDWTRIYPYGAGTRYWNSVDISDDGGVILVCGFVGAYPNQINIALSSQDQGDTWAVEIYESAIGGNVIAESAAIAGDGSVGVVARYTYLTNLPIYVSVGYGDPVWSETTITPFARTLVDDATAAEAATTLGLGTGDSPTFAGLDLTGITDGYVPYVGVGALAASPIYTNGTNIAIGSTNLNSLLSLGASLGTKVLFYDGGLTGSGGNGLFVGFSIDEPAGNDTTLFTHAGGRIVLGKRAADLGIITPLMTISSAGLGTINDLTISAPSNIYTLSHDSFADFAAGEHFLQTAITNVSSALTTGLLKVTTGTGALSVITDSSANWDSAYTHSQIVSGNPHTVTKTDVGLGSVENTALSTWAGTTNITTLGTIGVGVWNGTTIAILNGGTGQTTAQAAIDVLTAVSGATNEHVLTKDTVSGNAIWKVATGGSDAFTVKIDAAATAGYIGAASNDGVLRTSTGLSYTDGGDYVTLGLDVPSLTELAAAPAQSTDFVLIYDTDAGAHKKIQPTNLGHRYVDRGDPAALDYTLASLTANGAWHDLDLGPGGVAIVPAGAVMVQLYLGLIATVANNLIQFRKNGNSNSINTEKIRTQVANLEFDGPILVQCDSNGVIEYAMDSGNWSYCNIAVRGWWV